MQNADNARGLGIKNKTKYVMIPKLEHYLIMTCISDHLDTKTLSTLLTFTKLNT